MEGIIFYDESNGVVPLKSTITNRGTVKLRRLDENNIRVIETISKIDPAGEGYPVHDEALMKVIDSVCKADVGHVPEEDALCWYRDYASFAKLVSAKWAALRDAMSPSVSAMSPSVRTAWRPRNGGDDTPQPEYFNSEEKGFFLLPVESVVPCLEQLGSMVRLWDALSPKNSLRVTAPENFHTIMNTKNIKVFDDTKHQLLHIAYPLHHEGDVILVRLKGQKVQTFELKRGNECYFVISMETPKADLVVVFLNFLEWGIDEAYDMLFEESFHEPASKIVVNLKIKNGV